MDEVDMDLINNCFNGDAEKYQSALSEDRYSIFIWNDIHSAATILPEMEHFTHRAIQNTLGYLPHPAIRLYFEPALRAVCKAWQSGGLSLLEYRRQLREHILPLRNEEMKACQHLGWNESIYQCYYNTSLLYDENVKTRLTRFLGYEPQLEDSELASIWSKDYMAAHNVLLSDNLTDIDLKAIGIIKYRDALFAEGIEAANASQLAGAMMLADY